MVGQCTFHCWLGGTIFVMPIQHSPFGQTMSRRNYSGRNIPLWPNGPSVIRVQIPMADLSEIPLQAGCSTPEPCP